MALRLFLGVFPPARIQQEIADRCAALQPSEARWVRAAQLHLTLLFLGDRPASELPALCAALDRAAAGGSAFALELREVSVFPNRRRARVLYLAAQRGAEELAALARRIRERLGEPAEPGFVPHLTLARFREPPAAAELERFARAFDGLRWGWETAEACLVQSELQPRGAFYRILHRSPLAPSAGG